jgi:hypothetical protein
MHTQALVDPYLKCRGHNLLLTKKITITAILGIAAILGITPKAKGFGVVGGRGFHKICERSEPVGRRLTIDLLV